MISEEDDVRGFIRGAVAIPRHCHHNALMNIGCSSKSGCSEDSCDKAAKVYLCELAGSKPESGRPWIGGPHD